MTFQSFVIAAFMAAQVLVAVPAKQVPAADPVVTVVRAEAGPIIV